MSAGLFLDPAANFHPFECDGPGACMHCDRREVWQGWCCLHDPRICALCDPEYDLGPRAAKTEWKGVYPGYCINPETCRGFSHCPRDYSCVE